MIFASHLSFCPLSSSISFPWSHLPLATCWLKCCRYSIPSQCSQCCSHPSLFQPLSRFTSSRSPPIASSSVRSTSLLSQKSSTPTGPRQSPQYGSHSFATAASKTAPSMLYTTNTALSCVSGLTNSALTPSITASRQSMAATLRRNIGIQYSIATARHAHSLC